MKEKYEQRLELMERGFRHEIDDLRNENKRLHETLLKMEEAIRDKDYIIETGKKLIARYEKEFERLSEGGK